MPDGRYWWGADVSVSRIAFAAIRNGEPPIFRSVSVKGKPGALRLADALTTIYVCTIEFTKEAPPLFVTVESPVGRHPAPALVEMVGVTKGVVKDALRACGLNGVGMEALTPPTWKKAALGKGNADKDDIARWGAQYGGRPRNADERDALGIAVAGSRVWGKG